MHKILPRIVTIGQIQFIGSNDMKYELSRVFSHHLHFRFTCVSILACVEWGFAEGFSPGQPIFSQS